MVKWFGFTDIHFPDQDDEALSVALRAHELFKPDYTIVGNDIINCTPFNRWPDSTILEATARDWNEHELIPANIFLGKVQVHTKKETIFLPGNHDCWVERWCAKQGKTGKAIYNLLSLKRNLVEGRQNFRYIDVTDPKQAQVKLHEDLYCVHGWSYCKHASAKHLELSKTKSIIFNHTHRIQTSYSRNPWEDKNVFAMSAGCLCKKQPMYRHDGVPTEWVHGFWVAYVGRHSFTVYPVVIEKGRAIMPNGKEVKI